MPTVMPLRPFRFAAGIGNRVDLAELVEYARQAESLGYAALLVPDHLLDHFAPYRLWRPSPRRRLRIGTFVLNNDFRHPAVLAHELATLDQLSGGRVELGLGAGWNAEEYQRLGLPFAAHHVRVERLAEGIQVLKGLFAPRPFTFHGRYFGITELEGRPGTTQPPHPPLLVGRGGPAHAGVRRPPRPDHRLGAKHSGALPSRPRSCFAEATAEKIAWMREAAGTRFADLGLNTYPCLLPSRSPLPPGERPDPGRPVAGAR